LLDTEDETIRAEIRRRIEERLKALADSLPKTCEQVHDALLCGEPKRRARVVSGLKREFLDDPIVFDYLRITAQSPSTDWRLKSAAIAALGRTRTAASAKLLLDLFTSSGKDRERAAALRALEHSAGVDPSVAQTMLDQLHDRGQPEAVRRFAVSGLANAPRSPEVRDALVQVLRSENDVHMRRTAIRGFRKYIRDPGMKDMLRALREREPDEQVAAAIDRLLARK
jgi:HEAT repeat protein